MPPFSEVDKTAPCKFVCTAIELFTSCRKRSSLMNISCYNYAISRTLKMQLRMSSLQEKLQILQTLYDQH